MQVPPAKCPRLDVSSAVKFQRGFVGSAEIRRSSNEPWNVLRKHVQHLAGSIPPSDTLGAGWKDREIAIPTLRQLAALHETNFGSELGIFALIVSKELRPAPPRVCTPRAYAIGEMLAHCIGNEKLGVLGPAIKALREADLLFAERLPMSLGRVMLMGRAVAYMAIQNDKGWPSLGITEGIQ